MGITDLPRVLAISPTGSWSNHLEAGIRGPVYGLEMPVQTIACDVVEQVIPKSDSELGHNEANFTPLVRAPVVILALTG